MQLTKGTFMHSAASNYAFRGATLSSRSRLVISQGRASSDKKFFVIFSRHVTSINF